MNSLCTPGRWHCLSKTQAHTQTHCVLWQGPYRVGAGAIWRPGRGNEAPPVAHVSDSASNWLSCRLFPPVPLPPYPPPPLSNFNYHGTPQGRILTSSTSPPCTTCSAPLLIFFFLLLLSFSVTPLNLLPCFSFLLHSLCSSFMSLSMQLWMYSNHYLPSSFSIIIIHL